MHHTYADTEYVDRKKRLPFRGVHCSSLDSNRHQNVDNRTRSGKEPRFSDFLVQLELTLQHVVKLSRAVPERGFFLLRFNFIAPRDGERSRIASKWSFMVHLSSSCSCVWKIE